jgi:hypothetical protein
MLIKSNFKSGTMELHSKGNNQENKMTTYRTGENICKLYIWHVVNMEII